MTQVIAVRPEITVAGTPINAEERMAAARIRMIDEQMERNPSEFMFACRHLGTLATQDMLDDAVEPTDDETKARMRTITQAIGTFVTKHDIRKASFDEQSDEAIYDDPAVLRHAKAAQQRSASPVKRNGVYESRGSTRAEENRDAGTVLSLYILARRKQQWQQQNGNHGLGNGAA